MWHSTFISIAALASLCTITVAAPAPAPAPAPEPVATPDFLCANTPYSRGCWGLLFDINTNYYQYWPNTGVVREYWLTVENITLAPDGYLTQVLAFNGQIPGPTLTANWGDTFKIHVQNNMKNNGTNVHWHGVRQYFTNMYDGTAGLTECPIAPGESHTYTFQATQYGTSWYHSHFSVQFGSGLVGALVVNGPATANYDIDLGPIMLSDWSHTNSFIVLESQVNAGLPDYLDGGLINGTGVFPCTPGWRDPRCTGKGQYFSTQFTPGKTHRIRLINGATQSYFRFLIDNHQLTVIANDFVPIVPYQTDSIVLAPGQRFDVLVTANQKPGNYWLRAVYVECYYNLLNNAQYNLGIVTYQGVRPATPTTTATPAQLDNTCYTNQIVETSTPHLALNVGPVGPGMTSNEVVTHNTSSGLSVLLWEMNGASFMTDWAYPTIWQLYDGIALNYLSNASYADYRKEPQRFDLDHIYNGQILAAEDIINMPLANQWIYFVLQSQVGIWHPMHMHGHDIYVMAQGQGTYVPGVTPLNTYNPPRRDVANLLPFGYLVLAWKTDNPGIWNMHCHIVWHVSQGFAVQFVERESEILAMYSRAVLDDTCVPWHAYIPHEAYGQDDSGF